MSSKDEKVPAKKEKRSVKRPASSDARRSETEIREQRLIDGSILLKFKIPAAASSEDSNHWRRIEKYGFQIDRKIGCLIPYQFAQAGSGKSAPRLGAALGARLFRNQSADPSLDSKKTELGWSRRHHVSHLCHLSSCCNPFHLHVEEAWKNWKRNYCGVNGECDCRMVPKCMRPYRPPEMTPPMEFVKYGDTDKAAVVSRILPGLSVKILASDAFAVEDQKKANRNKRLRKTRKHNAETNANIKAASASAAAAVAAIPADEWVKPDARKKSKTEQLVRHNAAIAAAAAGAAAAASTAAAAADSGSDDRSAADE